MVPLVIQDLRDLQNLLEVQAHLILDLVLLDLLDQDSLEELDLPLRKD